MARINVEESWWIDPRRMKLGRLLGSLELADGKMLGLWRIAQEYWKKGEMLPLQVFETIEGAEHVSNAGLTDVRGSFVYVRGCSNSFGWLENLSKKASEAGKKSAEARRKRLGSAQPKSKNSERLSNDSERLSNENEPSSNDLERSLSLSLSLSSSKKENIYISEIEKSEIGELTKEWGETLSAYGIKKDPKFDELAITRLVKIHGLEKTKLALRGARFEQESKEYKPAKHCNISRLSRPHVFERFVNLGAASFDAISTRTLYRPEHEEL